MKRHFGLIIVVGAVLVACVFFARGSRAGEGNLLSLISRAMNHNPEIRAAAHRYNADAEKIPQAGAWDDPNLFLTLSNIPVNDPSFSKTPMSGTEVGVRQKIPLSGSKGTNKRIAEDESKASASEYGDTVARIVYDIKSAYYDLAYVNEAIGITARNRKVGEGLVNIARARLVAMGDAPEQEVFLAQIDHVGYAKIDQDLQRKRATLSAKLKRLVADGREIPAPNLALFKSTDPKLGRSDIVERATTNHPRMQKRISALSAAERGVKLARQSWVPDIDLAFSYRFRERVPGDPVSGDDFFSVGVSLPIPVFGARKQARRIAQSREMLRESERMLEMTKNDLTFEAEDAWAAYERAKNNVAIISGLLLPNAHSALDASITAYEAERADFLNVLSSQIAVYRFEMELARDMADRLQALARLDYLFDNAGVVTHGTHADEGEDR